MARRPGKTAATKWSRSLTLGASAQNVDLSSLLPPSPSTMLRITGSGPTGAAGSANVEANGVASTHHNQAWTTTGASWGATANPPIATAAGGVGMTFDVDFDGRAGASRAAPARCSVNGTGYLGSYFNTNAAVLTQLRILGSAADVFSAGFRFVVEEI